MTMKRKQILSKEEALELHHKTLVIDSQQPPATNGFLFNNNMKIKLNELEQKGYKRNQAAGILASMAAMEIHKTDDAKMHLRLKYLNQPALDSVWLLNISINSHCLAHRRAI